MRMRYLIALTLASSSAMAQNNPEGDHLLGVAARNRPHYDGSDRQTTDAIPVLRYSWGPLFARTTQGMLEGGARMNVLEGLAVGVQLAYEVGPLDGDPGSSLGAHAEWRGKVGPAPFSALARFRNHTDSGHGRQFDTRLTVGVYGSGGLRAGVFGQATWASEKYFLAYYDVPNSGLLYTSAGVLGTYELGEHWLAVASVELRRLADDAASSVFVNDRTNSYAWAGVAYRF
jgi:outer membrane scaffolding protein for murein synthesis (MipA/OmpV family)